MLSHVVMSIQLPLRMQNENILYVNGMKMRKRKLATWKTKHTHTHSEYGTVSANTEWLHHFWYSVMTADKKKYTKLRKWAHFKINQIIWECDRCRYDLSWTQTRLNKEWLTHHYLNLCQLSFLIFNCGWTTNLQCEFVLRKIFFATFSQQIQIEFNFSFRRNFPCSRYFLTTRNVLWQLNVTIVQNTPTPSLTQLNHKILTWVTFHSNLAAPAITGNSKFSRLIIHTKNIQLSSQISNPVGLTVRDELKFSTLTTELWKKLHNEMNMCGEKKS